MNQLTVWSSNVSALGTLEVLVVSGPPWSDHQTPSCDVLSSRHMRTCLESSQATHTSESRNVPSNAKFSESGNAIPLDKRPGWPRSTMTPMGWRDSRAFSAISTLRLNRLRAPGFWDASCTNRQLSVKYSPVRQPPVRMPSSTLSWLVIPPSFILHHSRDSINSQIDFARLTATLFRIHALRPVTTQAVVLESMVDWQDGVGCYGRLLGRRRNDRDEVRSAYEWNEID